MWVAGQTPDVLLLDLVNSSSSRANLPDGTMEASQAKKRPRIQGVGPHDVFRCCEVTRHRTNLPSLLVIVLCLESSPQRSENAHQILNVLGESKRLRLSFDLELLRMQSFEGGRNLELSPSSQAVSTVSLRKWAPGYRLCPEWCIGSKDKWEKTVLHERWRADSVFKSSAEVQQNRRDLHATGGRMLKEGEVGCAITHHQAWGIAAEKDADYVLVLEDDVIFGLEDAANLAAVLEAVVQRGGAAWQLLYLFGFDQGCSGVGVETEGSRGPAVLQVRRLPHALPKEQGRTASVVGLPHGTSSTAAYVLSRSGRTQLLQSNFADQLINIDDYVNLAILGPADAHRPDLVKLLWPTDKPEFVALKVEPNLLAVNEHWPSTVVQTY